MARKKPSSVNEYIKLKKKKIFCLADKIIDEMDSKIQDAPLNQLSSVLGTILDKFGADEKFENQEGLLASVFEEFEDVK